MAVAERLVVDYDALTAQRPVFDDASRHCPHLAAGTADAMASLLTGAGRCAEAVEGAGQEFTASWRAVLEVCSLACDVVSRSMGSAVTRFTAWDEITAQAVPPRAPQPAGAPGTSPHTPPAGGSPASSSDALAAGAGNRPVAAGVAR